MLYFAECSIMMFWYRGFIHFPLLRVYKTFEYWILRGERRTKHVTFVYLSRFIRCSLFVCLFDTHLCCPLPFNLTLTLKFCQINTSLYFYLCVRCLFLHYLASISLFMHFKALVFMCFCLLNTEDEIVSRQKDREYTSSQKFLNDTIFFCVF